MRLRIVGLLVAASLFGCQDNRAFGPGQLKSYNDALMARYIGKNGSQVSGWLDRYNAAQDSDKKTIRNEVISSLLAIDDYNFQEYASRTAVLQRSSATAGDIIVLGLTSAAAITGGPQAKSVLSGVAAVVTGSRVAVDKEVFYDTALPILLDRMQALRATKRQEIESSLKQDASTYSLQAALSDVYDYFRDGTLAAAVSDISKETAEKTAAASPSVQKEMDNFAAALNGKNVSVDQESFQISKPPSWDSKYTTLTVSLTQVAGSPKAANLPKESDLDNDLKNALLATATSAGFTLSQSATSYFQQTGTIVKVDDASFTALKAAGYAQ